MNLNPLTWFQTKALPVPSSIGQTSIMPPLDHVAYLKQRSERDLINLYRDTAYYCANLNARGVARTPLLMYKKSGTGRPVGKCAKRIKKLSVKQAVKAAGYISDDDELDEIQAHPFLDLLEKPFQEDGVGLMGKFTFLEITQLYLEDVGRAYWLMEEDEAGLPIQLFPLISPNVEAWKAMKSVRFVDKYKYQTGSGTIEYEPSRIVPFLCPDLRNPYTGGYSPMQAASDRLGVNLSYMAQTQSLLNNRARPDLVLAPKGPDEMVSVSTRNRLEKWFRAKFSRSNTGAPLISPQALDMHVLTYSPKDMGELNDDENAVKQIARIFDIPLSMLDRDANRASASEGRKQHAYDALCPRLKRIEHAINACIMPRYDPAGNTFVMFDEPYKEPLAPEPKDVPAFVSGGILMPDEVREMLGYGPMPEEYKAELEKRRQDELSAKKPPMKPGESKNVSKLRWKIRNREAVNGCGHR